MNSSSERVGRFPLRSKSDIVGAILQSCADMIREANTNGSSLTPNQIAYVLRFLASSPGTDIELELTAKAGIAFYQLRDFIPKEK